MTPTFDKGKAAGKSESVKRAELETALFNLRYDMDCIGEEIDISEELKNLSDEELQKLINEYQES